MGQFQGWGGAALVTGASGGIGLEIARLLAKRGLDVILVARSVENLRILAQNLTNQYSVRAVPIPMDLSTITGPGEVMRQLAAVDMDVDLLVNNAGFGIFGRFGEATAEREVEMIRLNVSAPTELAARFLPGMLRRRRGVILNVASTAGFAPVPWIGTYAATKAYLISWTQALDVELQGTGVRASVLCPGTTATKFQEVSGASRLQHKIPKQATAREVAEACLRGLDRGSRVIVPGNVNRLHRLAAKIMPTGIAASIAYRAMRAKKSARSAPSG